MNPDELREKRERLQGELADRRRAPASDRDEIASLLRSIEKVDDEIVTADARIAEIARLAKRPENRSEPGPDPRERTRNMRTKKRDTKPGGEARDAARRAIDSAYEANDLPEADGFRLNDLIERDKFGADAAYIAAIGDPHYETAFAKKIAGVGGAEQELEEDEREAMLAVGRAMAQRSLAVGEGSTGGFAIPLALDPTIILTSSGAVSPLRQLASTATITTSEWKGVASEGVEAHFRGEGEEAADDSPELSQPAIVPQRADCFVPFSAEVGEDWAGIRTELARLMADAKDVLEAEKFLSGTGTKQPFGLLKGATEIVETATEGKLAVDDPYTLAEALPPRFQPNASWLTSLTIANNIARFAGPGSEEPSLFNDARDRLLMKPWSECSDMASKVESEAKVAVYGDLKSGFKVVDRIGMRIELIQNLMGENNRPLGQRGLFCFWRTGSKVVNKAAIRVLEVK